MADTFNIVDISEAKDRFDSIIPGEMAFSGAFVGRQFCAAIGKGDGDTAGLNVTEVTDEWSIVAGGASVRLMMRGWRRLFSCPVIKVPQLV